VAGKPVMLFVLVENTTMKHNYLVLVVQWFGVMLVIERSLVRLRPGRYQVN